MHADGIGDQPWRQFQNGIRERSIIDIDKIKKEVEDENGGGF